MDNSSKRTSVKVKLSDINELVFKKIPKPYGEILFNLLVAKAIQDGSFIKEAALFLSPDIIQNLIPSTKIQKEQTNKKHIKTNIQEKNNDNGFEF